LKAGLWFRRRRLAMVISSLAAIMPPLRGKSTYPGCSVFPSHLFPMRRGFLYLVAIMDWATRKVLAWRVSNTLHADFCTEALEDALARHGPPEIFNTDQGAQFTSPRFTGVLLDAKVRISMDGKGRWMDNVFIERLWRSLKYECIYLRAFETGSELRAGLRAWIDYYNAHRPHSALGGKTPAEAYAVTAEYQAVA
jgi:putative transposase